MEGLSMHVYTLTTDSAGHLDLRVRTLNLQNIVAHAVDVLRTLLYQTVRETLHVLDLSLPRHTILVVVVAEHSCPWDATLGHGLGKLGQYRTCVPCRALTVELITGENNHVGFLYVEDMPQKSIREVVRPRAR